MENNLDNYFKDNLEDRSFEFKNVYWEEAEKLLEANERKRRRWLIWWWFGIGLGCVAISSGLWFLLKTNAPVASGAKTPATVPAEMVEKPGISNAENNLENTAEYLSENPAGNNSKINKNSENKTPYNYKSLINKGNSSNSSQKLINPVNTQKTTENSSQAAQTTGSPTTSLPKNNDIVLDENNHVSLPAEAVAESNPPPPSPETSAKAPEGSFLRDLFVFDALDMRLVFAEGVFPKRLKIKEIAPEKASPWQIGVIAAQLWLRDSSGNHAIGYEGGLAIQRQLKKGWFFTSGLRYQRRSGTFEVSKAAESRSYRFGVSYNGEALRPTSLHYLKVPVFIGWQKRRHVLEGGFTFDYLLGIRGELGSYQRTTEPPVRKVFTPEEKGWIQEDGYRKLIPGVAAGYRYRVSHRLSFGATADYAIGGILEHNYDPPAGTFLLKESGSFFAGLQAVYFLK